jgi:SnoaL-like domain
MSDAAAVITRYIELVGAHDLDPLDELFAHSVVATTSGGTFDKAEWIAALRRLLPALVRNEIRQVYSNAAGACVVYDFVTDTPAGAVTCAEWITLDPDGRIATVELLFEKANWAHVIEALKQGA